jgi:hypothetical protein
MKLNIQSRKTAPWSALTLVAVAAGLTACGGGGSGSMPAPAPTPQNMAPVLSPLAAQTVDQDTSTPALAFTVSDDGGVSGVMLSVSSSDPNLLPEYGLALGGSGANRTITVLPAEDAAGSANVTVTAADAQGKATTVTFAVTVKAVSQSIASYTTSAFALMETDTPVQVSGYTFVQDADDEATFDPLLQ